MSTLHEKLKELIDQIHSDGYDTGRSGGGDPDFDDYIKQIEQAFIDDGWVRSPHGCPKHEDFNFTCGVCNKYFMTGQEWYDRFDEAVADAINRPLTQAEGKILEAAKRASGLDTDHEK